MNTHDPLDLYTDSALVEWSANLFLRQLSFFGFDYAVSKLNNKRVRDFILTRECLTEDERVYLTMMDL